MLGGLVLGVLPDAEFGPTELVVRRLPLPRLPAVVVLPDFQLLTADARAALPLVVSRTEAIFNTSRVALLVHGLMTGDHQTLRVAMGDRLHQTARLGLIPGAAEALAAAYEAGAIGAALSGAGPSLIAFAETDRTPIAQAMRDAFAAAGLSSRTWYLEPTGEGVQVAIRR
jgi:homoserine kinase